MGSRLDKTYSDSEHEWKMCLSSNASKVPFQTIKYCSMKLFTRHLRSTLCLLLLNNVTFIQFRQKRKTIFRTNDFMFQCFSVTMIIFSKQFRDKIVLFDPGLVTGTIYAARPKSLITPGLTCFQPRLLVFVQTVFVSPLVPGNTPGIIQIRKRKNGER